MPELSPEVFVTDTASTKNSLIVVSNRLPFVLKTNPETKALERKPRWENYFLFLQRLYIFFGQNLRFWEISVHDLSCSAGGLVTAVCPVVINGKGLWVGWSGLHMKDDDLVIPESDPNDHTPTAGLKSSQVS